MIYVWLDKNSGKTVEVSRPMEAYDVPPTPQEALDAGVVYEEAEWEKRVTGGSGTIGFGLKGSW